LWDFSLEGGKAGSPPRDLPWGACPRLLSPRGALAPTSRGDSPRATLTLVVGGALLLALLCFAAAILRVGSAGSLTSLFQRLDIYALSHELEDRQVQSKRRTALGGACTLLAITLIALFAAYMVVSWLDNNTLVQRSLDALDGGVWEQAAGLPWASAAALPGLAAPAPGIVVRITVDGDPGACAEPLLPPISSGLVSGAWARAPAAPPGCGGSGVSQLTFTCAACVLGPSSSLSLLLHHSCQSLLLEAAAVAPYPADAAAILAADTAATAAAADGARLSSVSWDVGPLFGVLWDNVTASASRKGYAFTRSVATPARAVPAPLGVDAYLTVAPLSAAVNITLLLPLSSTYVTTLLTERVPWTQLLANIVGLSGIIGAFGTVFGMCEKRLGRRDAPHILGGEAPEKGAFGGGAAVTRFEASVSVLHADVASLRAALFAVQQELDEARGGGGLAQLAREALLRPPAPRLRGPGGGPETARWEGHAAFASEEGPQKALDAREAAMMAHSWNRPLQEACPVLFAPSSPRGRSHEKRRGGEGGAPRLADNPIFARPTAAGPGAPSMYD
jgi:hypothetical protein